MKLKQFIHFTVLFFFSSLVSFLWIWSVTKESRYSNLNEIACSDQASLALHSMARFPTFTTSSVRWYSVYQLPHFSCFRLVLLVCSLNRLAENRRRPFPGSFPFRGLVGGPCQSCLRPNSVVSRLEQHLLFRPGALALRIAGQYLGRTEGNILAIADCKKLFYMFPLTRFWLFRDTWFLYLLTWYLVNFINHLLEFDSLHFQVYCRLFH